MNSKLSPPEPNKNFTPLDVCKKDRSETASMIDSATGLGFSTDIKNNGKPDIMDQGIAQSVMKLEKKLTFLEDNSPSRKIETSSPSSSMKKNSILKKSDMNYKKGNISPNRISIKQAPEVFHVTSYKDYNQDQSLKKSCHCNII